ncbi:unnamed protein product [Camellia sinensis]
MIPSFANYLDLYIGKAVLQCGLHQNSCVMDLNFVPAKERDNGISTNHCFNHSVISLLFKRVAIGLLDDLKGDSFYFDTPGQEDPNSQSKHALQSDAKSHFCSNKNYSSDERSCKTPCNNFSEREHIFLLKRKLLSDFDNSDMRQPSIPFEGNRDLSHQHLRQSAARPAGGNTKGDTEANGLRGVDHLSCERPFAEILNCKVHARFCRSVTGLTWGIEHHLIEFLMAK